MLDFWEFFEAIMLNIHNSRRQKYTKKVLGTLMICSWKLYKFQAIIKSL